MISNQAPESVHALSLQADLAEKFGLDCTALAREEGFIPPAYIWVSAPLIARVSDGSAARFGLRRLLYAASRANRGDIPRITATHYSRPIHLFQHVISKADGNEERVRVRVEVASYRDAGRFKILAITAADEVTYWHSEINWN